MKHYNLFIQILEVLSIKYTEDFTLRFYEGHPHKNNLLGLSLREDTRVLTPKEMKSLKGGSVSCKCEGNPDPYFKPNCDACKEGRATKS